MRPGRPLYNREYWDMSRFSDGRRISTRRPKRPGGCCNVPCVSVPPGGDDWNVPQCGLDGG